MTRRRIHLKIEEELRTQGFRLIAGIDEVGRGCLAGPVVAAAVILPENRDCFNEVDDSKKLSPQKRESCFDLILEKALALGVGVVEASDIDRMNISRASLKAMRLAVEAMNRWPDFLLIDGNQPIKTVMLPQWPMIKGDAKCLSIAAASIVAKVTRDRLMQKLATQYPGYRFDLHKGYGTAKHLEELKNLGPTPIHRLSFGSVKNCFTLFDLS